MKVFLLLVLYNFIFILPLLIILTMAFFGVKTETISKWKNDKKRWMRLFIGLIMIALGIFLILWTKGIINFGLAY
jgi:cytochrome c biogenesis protein CcdA